MSFLGNKVSLQIFSPDLSHIASSRVTRDVSENSVEFRNLENFEKPGHNLVEAQIDIKNDTIAYKIYDENAYQFLDANFNGFVVRDASGDIPRIVDVHIIPSTNSLHIDDNDIFFTENAVFANVEGLPIDFGDGFALKVTFAIEGNDRNNNLSGTNGKDWIFGEGGRDRIDGGRGFDELTGGAGADQFVFNGHYGKDTITDFQNNVDTLQLDASSLRLHSVNDALSHARVVGGSVVFTFDTGDRLILEHFSNINALRDDIFLA